MTTDTPGSELLGPPERETAPHFSDMAEDYDRFLRVLQPDDSEINRWLGEHMASGRRALDVGCGAGRLSVMLAERYEQVLAVDAAPGMIEVAERERARPNIRYEVRDIRTLTPGHDGLFDAVLVVSCLLHVGETGPLLAQLRELVAPGGTLLIAEPQQPEGFGSEGWQTDYAFGHARAIYERTGRAADAIDALRMCLSAPWYKVSEIAVPVTRESFQRDFAEALPGSEVHRSGDKFGVFLLSWQAPEQP